MSVVGEMYSKCLKERAVVVTKIELGEKQCGFGNHLLETNM